VVSARAVAAALLFAARLAAQQPALDELRLRNVIVTTSRPLFDGEDSWLGLLFLVAPAPDPKTVEREVWLRAGEPIDARDTAEVERLLRHSDRFAPVTTHLEPVGNGEADLWLETQPRWPLLVGAAPSFTGGRTRLHTALEHHDLLGTGKQAAVFANATMPDQEHGFGGHLRDPRLFGTWASLTAGGGATGEGGFGEIAIDRPLHDARDATGFGARLDAKHHDLDFFRAGDAVAQVPQRRQRFAAWTEAGFGTADRRGRARGGITLQHADHRPTTGRDAALHPAPGDTTVVSFGWQLSGDVVTEHLELERLDGLDFVEDVALGFGVGGGLTTGCRTERGKSDELQSTASGHLHGAAQPLTETLALFHLHGSYRWHSTTVRGYRAGAALHLYQQSLPAQTVAARVAFDLVTEKQDLQPEFLLDEEHGVRGIPSWELAGTRRLLVTLENRICPRLLSGDVHAGLAVFGDAGWIWNEGESLAMDDACTAVGCGLRLGSQRWLGRRVLRIDVTVPLRHANGRDLGVLVSVAFGQVFPLLPGSRALGEDF
jgi:hypothetical protein